MENEKIGYVTITTEEYKELITDKIEKDDIIEDLECQIYNISNRHDIYEKEVLDSIYNIKKYSIEKLEIINGYIEKNYHYFDVYQEFVKRDIHSVGYIDTTIKKLYKRYLEEMKGEKNE